MAQPKQLRLPKTKTYNVLNRKARRIARNIVANPEKRREFLEAISKPA